MKKNYSKPDITKESLDLHPAISTACDKPELAWGQIPMLHPETGELVNVFVSDIGCDLTEHEYMELNGDDDGSCIYASTSDGATFS